MLDQSPDLQLEEEQKNDTSPMENLRKVPTSLV